MDVFVYIYACVTSVLCVCVCVCLCVANIIKKKNKMIKSYIKGVNTVYSKIIRRATGKRRTRERKKGGGEGERVERSKIYLYKNTST